LIGSKILDNNVTNKQLSYFCKQCGGFFCTPNILPIYFDHKLPDYYSSFQQVLAIGSYPIGPYDECKIMPLIDNCSVDIYNTAIFGNACQKSIFDVKNIHIIKNHLQKIY
jgi:hypothetical protein